MPRPKGSTNRSPRELRAEAERLKEKAALMERLAKANAKKTK